MPALRTALLSQCLCRNPRGRDWVFLCGWVKPFVSRPTQLSDHFAVFRGGVKPLWFVCFFLLKKPDYRQPHLLRAFTLKTITRYKK